MPTPFRDGEVDVDAIRRNVRRFVESGLGGVVALGTNGEAAMLDVNHAGRDTCHGPVTSHGIELDRRGARGSWAAQGSIHRAVNSSAKAVARIGSKIDPTTTYMVDSIVVSREHALGIAQNKIASVEVRKDSAGGRSLIAVNTIDAKARRRQTGLVRDSVAAVRVTPSL